MWQFALREDAFSRNVNIFYGSSNGANTHSEFLIIFMGVVFLRVSIENSLGLFDMSTNCVMHLE